jgi:hypothetical protein
MIPLTLSISLQLMAHFQVEFVPRVSWDTPIAVDDILVTVLLVSTFVLDRVCPIVKLGEFHNAVVLAVSSIASESTDCVKAVSENFITADGESEFHIVLLATLSEPASPRLLIDVELKSPGTVSWDIPFAVDPTSVVHLTSVVNSVCSVVLLIDLNVTVSFAVTSERETTNSVVSVTLNGPLLVHDHVVEMHLIPIAALLESAGPLDAGIHLMTWTSSHCVWFMFKIKDNYNITLPRQFIRIFLARN